MSRDGAKSATGGASPNRPADGLPRVLILSHMYPSRLDDAMGDFIHEHVRALRALGVQTRVVSPVPWSPRPLWIRKRWRHYGALRQEGSWQSIEVARPAYLHPPTVVLQAAAGTSMAAGLLPLLVRLRREFPFDLIHAHTVTPDGLAAVILERLLGVPTVVSARGSEIHEAPVVSRTRRWATTFTLRRCDRFLSVSGALAADAERLAGRALDATVIYNGVDTIRFTPARAPEADRADLGLRADLRWWICVAQCEAPKGICELYTAFRQLEGAGLIVIGEGSLRSWLQESAERDRIGSRLVTPGRIGRDDVARYLRAAHAFVLPSHGEGVPNAMLEAMATGLPVVATRVGGIPEIVTDGEDGLLVPPRDAQSLTASMRRLFETPGLAYRLGAAAASIRNRLSWETNARQHLDVYRDLIRSWQAPAGGRGAIGFRQHSGTRGRRSTFAALGALT